MKNQTLRKYLLNKRIELYEEVDELKDILFTEDFTEADRIALDVAEAKLNLVKEIIEICVNRGNKF